jgi:hypothetical protein
LARGQNTIIRYDLADEKRNYYSISVTKLQNTTQNTKTYNNKDCKSNGTGERLRINILTRSVPGFDYAVKER